MDWPRGWRARIVRYRITPRGEEALRHMQALEKLIREEGVAWRDTLASQAAVDFAGDETKAF
jgi:DNA-binding PadR family transcriptional regulator